MQLRSRRWLVENVVPASVPSQSARVQLACADDDAQGQSLEVESESFRDALSCSLELLGTDPLKKGENEKGRPVWHFPVLTNKIQSDSSWAATLDTLRTPRKTDQKLAEWRKETSIRPVVFEDQGVLSDDVVHLHLEQRVAQRLLARFRAQGFVHHDLSRACLAQAADSIPRVILPRASLPVRKRGGAATRRDRTCRGALD